MPAMKQMKMKTKMDRTTVTCTDTESVVGADILSQSDKRLKVAVDGTAFTLTMFKKTRSNKLYVGNMGGLEFTSTGD